jgi:beta-glucosidase
MIPPDFTMGVATAAFQIEGATTEDGRGPSVWDVFSAKPGNIVGGNSPKVACDHYHRMPEDVALMRELGIGSYRFSLSWPRIQPDGMGPPNRAGLDFYDRLIDELLAAGISPMVTLFHWDTPQALQEKGGWMNRDTAYRLASFASIAAEAFGDRVAQWVTINEPATVSTNGYALGLHAPGEVLQLGALPSVHHQLLGHGLCVQVLRGLGVVGEIGLSNVHSPVVPANDTVLDRLSAGLMDTAQNRLYADPVLLGRYPDLVNLMGRFSDFSPSAEDMTLISQPLDFYGLNYYLPSRIEAGPGESVVPAGMAQALGDDLSGTVPGAPFHITDWPGVATTAFGWPILPEYLGVTLAELAERYPGLPPVIITEGGASFLDEPEDVPDGVVVRDTKRIEYLESHLRAALEATAPGGAAEAIKLRGYYVWTLMDNFEWSAGFKQRFGLVHVDFETLERTPKQSYYWLRDLLAAGSKTGPPQDSSLARVNTAP